MGEGTGIEWATDTWNPVIGCAKVSPACTHCYAETYAAQRLGRPELWRGERHVTSASTWGLPERVERRAARDGVRARLFVASLSDVFEDHPVWAGQSPWWPEYSLRTAALHKLANLRHTDVLLLTKRPENIPGMVPIAWLRPGEWPAHVWVGTTVEDQQRADERIPHLLRVPARVRFLSVEPMLGPVNFAPWFVNVRHQRHAETGETRRITEYEGAVLDGDAPTTNYGCTSPGHRKPIDWVIAGGESGPKARPAHPNWFRSLRDECAAAGVPFLFKQWGEWAPLSGAGLDLDGRDAGLYASNRKAEDGEDQGLVDELYGRRCTVPTLVLRADGRHVDVGDPTAFRSDLPGWPVVQAFRIGKKRAGRELDGVTHDAVPEVTRG